MTTAPMQVSEDAIYRGSLVLVNYAYPLPEGYEPEELIYSHSLVEPSNASGFSASRDGIGVNREAGESLTALIGYAWDTHGVGGFTLISGYRDFNYQAFLHQRKIQEYRDMGYSADDAGRAAAFWVARPRQSEHHTGLALDLPSRSHPGLTTSYANTTNGQWLAEHSWKHGFVVRYPQDKSEITMIGFEPWHIRYVGRPHSEIIHVHSWCLEEYLAFLQKEGGCTFRDKDGAIWQIDYQPIADGAVETPADQAFSISGDGKQGFIISTRME